MAIKKEFVDQQIVASNLSVTYFPGQSNEVKSLDNINLSISEGEFIIFFGPSGCGKSTLLYSIAGLEKFTGNISVEGRDLSGLSKHELEIYHRDTIGMVFQAYHLIPTLTVLQNVVLPLVLAGVKPSERKKQALELLDRFGVSSQANRLPNELSGGQQQRVAICRAVINNPQIILADEPLGNLDSKSANEVINLFKDINTKSGKTVILVTHDPTYLDIAHRVFFIKDGRVVDTKVNRNVKEKVVKDVVSSGHIKEMDFLSNHYSKLKDGQSGALLQAYQAKNLATLSLTELSAEDFDVFKEKIEISLKANDDFATVFEFLDVSPEEGGLGLDSRTALKITQKIRSLFSELKMSTELIKLDKDPEKKVKEEKEEIIFRQSLFDEFNIILNDPASLKIVDELIISRVKNEITAREFYVLLDKPIKNGGAGLDRRAARKIAKRFELWMIKK